VDELWIDRGPVDNFATRSRFPFEFFFPIIVAIVRRGSRAVVDLPTLRALMDDISAGIRVLQSRDGVELSDEQIQERARNIVTGLMGNYRIASLDAAARPSRAAAAPEQLDLLPTPTARA
jgi:hypothetical protein